jgi:hypothetical protein
MNLGPITLTWIVGVLFSCVCAIPLVLFREGKEPPSTELKQDLKQ